VVVARLVTIIALAGSVPYMALQLRSIGSALAIVTGRRRRAAGRWPHRGWWHPP
jgi:Na+/proline symporter